MKTRRDFFKYSALAGISTLSLPQIISAKDDFSDDYKALVVIYLAGGNDSLNTFIPISSNSKSGYSNYANIRENLRVNNNELILPINNGKLELSSGNGNPYYAEDKGKPSISKAYTKGVYKHTINGKLLDVGTNGLMPELAHLVNRGQVAIVSNVGNLIEPAKKEEFQSAQKKLPPFLYAHNHQTKLIFNGEAKYLNHIGWAGKLYDEWKGINGSSLYNMNISFSGVSHMLYGNETAPLILNPKGLTPYKNLNANSDLRGLYNSLMNTQRREIFTSLYNKLRKNSFNMQDILIDDWNNFSDFDALSSTNSYGQKLFSRPNTSTLGLDSGFSGSLLEQLKSVAKLAKIGKNRGLKRQVFYVVQSGYDTHSNQSKQHAKLLRELSMGIGDFYNILEEIDMQNSVTTFNISEFGRSTGDNGDGTDHAWGGSYFVVGGAVKGGLYGKMPDLTLGGDDDLTKKGRVIPSISISQYYGTIVKWFGADDKILNKIFPELKNFSNQDLGFMM